MADGGNLIRDNLNLQIMYLYGSARLGVINADTLVRWKEYDGTIDEAGKFLSLDSTIKDTAGYFDSSYATRYTGRKRYEITNHLGNVLAVVSDRKMPCDTPANSYKAEVIEATDYYAYGSRMNGRGKVAQDTGYRYSFNGKEEDGETGWQDYGFRMYDPKVVRFLSVDPLTKDYPWYTPYQFAGGKPVGAIDLDGLEELWVTVRAFIPDARVDNPDFINAGKYPYYQGDNRHSYQSNALNFRTEQGIFLDYNNQKSVCLQSASSSVALGSNGLYKASSDPSEDAGTLNVKMLGATAIVNVNIDSKNKHAASRNPLAPAINAQISLKITPISDGSFNYNLDIPRMDGFPAFEIWVQDKSKQSYLLFGRNPTESGEGPLSLFGSGEHSFMSSGNSKHLPKGPVISFDQISNPKEEE